MTTFPAKEWRSTNAHIHYPALPLDEAETDDIASAFKP